MSCSAWSKWIEITSMAYTVCIGSLSCSAWSKWIEIGKVVPKQDKILVLLRMEQVD